MTFTQNDGAERQPGAQRQSKPHYSTESPINRLLPRLDGVRQTGLCRYIARCPAHDDQRPSLSVRDLDDGRILIHCFAGCETSDVLDAVGLKFSDLFPEILGHHFKSERRPFPATDVLKCLQTEALVVVIASHSLCKGNILESDSIERLSLAEARINAAMEVINAFG